MVLVAVFLVTGMVAWRFGRVPMGGGNGQSFRIVRYDRMVEDYVETGNISLWQRMNTEFPLETQTLVENVLRIGLVDDEGIEDSLRAYYSDSTLCRVRADVTRQFENMSYVEKKLGSAFSKLAKEVEGFTIPKVYAQNSAFNESIVVGDSLIGISLDKYLGADYPLYRLFFYGNQRVTMGPDRIVQDCLSFYLNHVCHKSLKHGTKPRLINCMIHQGKINWVVARLTNSRLLNIAAVQPATKQWYKLNERHAWERLNQEKLLQSTDSALIHSVMYSNDAHPFFNDTHSRGVGLWIGMRIIDSYMKHHPSVTLGQLLQETDYERILNEAQYFCIGNRE